MSKTDKDTKELFPEVRQFLLDLTPHLNLLNLDGQNQAEQYENYIKQIFFSEISYPGSNYSLYTEMMDLLRRAKRSKSETDYLISVVEGYKDHLKAIDRYMEH